MRKMEGNFKKVALDKVKENPENPRTVSEYKLDQLVNSILTFPRMLELRPIVVSDDGTAIGGNMRKRGLDMIGSMPVAELESRLSNDVVDTARRSDLLSCWKK